VRADVDVDRHRQDDCNEAPAGGAAAAFQHQEQQDCAADDALDRQHGELVGERLVADEDVAAQDQRHDGAGVVERAREPRPARHQRPGQRGEKADPQEPRNVERVGEAIADVDQDGDDRDRAGEVDLPEFPLVSTTKASASVRPRDRRHNCLGVERKIETPPGNIEHSTQHVQADQDARRTLV
jgi:hypothetical protein